jgi:hypothetical protein
MEGLNQVFAAHSPSPAYDYKMVLSMYMALRDKGHPHQDAIQMMTEVLSDPNARQMILDRMNPRHADSNPQGPP